MKFRLIKYTNPAGQVYYRTEKFNPNGEYFTTVSGSIYEKFPDALKAYDHIVASNGSETNVEVLAIT